MAMPNICGAALRAMVYNVEKTLKERRDKVGTEDATNIEDALAETKKAMT